MYRVVTGEGDHIGYMGWLSYHKVWYWEIFDKTDIDNGISNEEKTAALGAYSMQRYYTDLKEHGVDYADKNFWSYRS